MQILTVTTTETVADFQIYQHRDHRQTQPDQQRDPRQTKTKTRYRENRLTHTLISTLTPSRSPI